MSTPGHGLTSQIHRVMEIGRFLSLKVDAWHLQGVPGCLLLEQDQEWDHFFRSIPLPSLLET
jgi:hypothetical protein